MHRLLAYIAHLLGYLAGLVRLSAGPCAAWRVRPSGPDSGLVRPAACTPVFPGCQLRGLWSKISNVRAENHHLHAIGWTRTSDASITPITGPLYPTELRRHMVSRRRQPPGEKGKEEECPDTYRLGGGRMKREAREHYALYSHAYIVNQDSPIFPLVRGIFKILSVICSSC